MTSPSLPHPRLLLLALSPEHMVQDMAEDIACSACCSSCRLPTRHPIPSSPANDPYSLRNLLPAGTITLPAIWEDSLCDHQHTEDDWHLFHGSQIAPYLSAEEDRDICRFLDFLVLHHFLTVHCRPESFRNIIYLRIYIIPYDISNVQGRLRNRDEMFVVRPAKKALKTVLPRIVQDKALWYAYSDISATGAAKHFIGPQIDNRSLATIYGKLPSPHIDEDTLYTCGPTAQKLVKHIQAGHPLEGLRSRLYRYQRHTVSVMLLKELSTATSPDPLYIPVEGLNGTLFYFQPGTLEFLRERPMVVSDQGGILCEELGTGKTVMILALVLATIDQLPKPEESFHDTRPVMTPLAFRHFPGAPFSDARSKLAGGGGRRARIDGTKTVPTLVEGLVHRIRLHPDKIDARRHRGWLDARKLGKLLDLNVPFYFHYDPPAPEARHSRRRSSTTGPGPRIVYLSTATLIVVPPNLLAQWISEIHKHCLDTLRVLAVKPEDTLPRARRLATHYDIVLLNHDSLAKEESRSNIAAAHTWKACECPGYHETRVPRCHCRFDLSPLFQIRWKRLVVDEGHVHGTDKTRISRVASLLSVERRWLVSGTPTTDLLGLSFGAQSESIEEDLRYPASLPIGSDNNDTEDDKDEDAPIGNGADVSSVHQRKWTQQDRNNLKKLGTMIATFLQVPRFADPSKLFNTHVIQPDSECSNPFDAYVIQPLYEETGPRPGTVQVLAQVMASTMVRHRIEDIEDDIVLPPLKQETVLLDLDPIVVTSYNALQAGILINAIDSLRVDQDYLFHPSQAAALQTLVGNYSQLMFWHVDDHLYNVDEQAKDIDNRIAKAQERQVSAEDLTLLEESKKHIDIAANDKIWRAVQKYSIPEIPFLIADMPKSVFQAWSELPDVPLDWDCPGFKLAGLIFHFRLMKLRETVLAHPLASVEGLIHYGKAYVREDAERIALFLRHNSTSRRHRGSKKHDGADKGDREVTKANETATQTRTSGKIEEVQREFKAVQERRVQPSDSLSAEAPTNALHAAAHKPSPLLRQSPLANTRIVRTRSSKLDFILKEIMQYSSTDKFLVFSGSPLTLAHVADALGVLGVDFLQYTTKMHMRVREQFVMTFETSDKYRVFLMELKHGSRGLNLISASRVLFCEPVWQADVEAQAIKRAHRIGQTRAISVKTLAIRGTFEEVMMSRRAELKGQDQTTKVSGITEDFRMRNFIANPQFMMQTQYRPILLDQPFLPKPPAAQPSQSAPVVAINEDGNAPMADRGELPNGHLEAPPKKKRMVRFV